MDSFTPEQIATLHCNDVTYFPEDDVHFPTLTVKETLSLAAKTCAPWTCVDNQMRTEYRYPRPSCRVA